MSSNKLFGDWHGTPRGDDEDALYTPTPVGMPCGFCESKIKLGDVGEMMPFLPGRVMPVHRKCLMQRILPPEVLDEIEAME